MKRILVLLILALFLFTAVLSAMAAEFKAGQEYILDQDSKAEGNLYVAGNNVNINGRIDGDFFGAGQTISITGEN
jgi:hypothetical protein